MTNFTDSDKTIAVFNPKTGAREMWSSEQVVGYYASSAVVGTRPVVTGTGANVVYSTTKPLQIDADWYMTNGPGAEINALDFKILKYIYDNPQLLTAGQTISVKDYALQHNVSRSIKQVEYVEYVKGKADDAWAYVFGQSAFALIGNINKDAAGNISITNVSVKPIDDQFNIEPDKAWDNIGGFLANISNSIDSLRYNQKEVPMPMVGTGKLFKDITRDTYDAHTGDYVGKNDIPFCFLAGTQILMADGSQKSIEEINIGDLVASFDPHVAGGLGALTPKRVINIFRNYSAEAIEFDKIKCTPGHFFLTAPVTGSNQAIFKKICDLVAEDAFIVDLEGRLTKISTKNPTRIISNNDKPTQFETYNFEVEEFHTYIADGYRVHNDSAITLVVADAEFKNAFKHDFDGSLTSIEEMVSGIMTGKITAYADYVALLSDDRYAATAYDWMKEKNHTLFRCPWISIQCCSRRYKRSYLDY